MKVDEYYQLHGISWNAYYWLRKVKTATLQQAGFVELPIAENKPVPNTDFSASKLQNYLSGYKGTLVTNGYQTYYTLMKNSDTIRVSSCWSHARRKFANIVKTAATGVALASTEERVDNRQLSV